MTTKHDTETERRDFIRIAGLGAAGLLIAGCDPGEQTEAETSDALTDYASGAGDVVDTLADLRNIGTGAVTGLVVRGHSSAGDGGVGFFLWDATSTDNDNDGTIIRPNNVWPNNPGRWLRVVSTHVDVQWFGARGDTAQPDVSVQFDAALADARNRGLPLFVPPGQGAGYKIEDIELLTDDRIVCATTAVLRGRVWDSILFRAGTHGGVWNIVVQGGVYVSCGVVFKQAGGTVSSTTFRDMEVNGRVGFEVDAAVGCKWNRCQFNNNAVAGIVITRIGQTNHNTVESCKFQPGNVGVDIQAGGTFPPVNLNVRDCWFEGLAREAINVAGGAKALHISGCHFESNQTSASGGLPAAGIALRDKCIAIVIDGCQFSGAASETARVLVERQSSLEARNCTVFLTQGAGVSQVFVAANGNSGAAVHLWNNYLSASGVYSDRLFSSGSSQRVSYSVYTGSGGFGGASAAEWRFAGDVFADAVTTP